MPYYPALKDLSAYYANLADHGLLAATLAPTWTYDAATMATAGRLELSRIRVPVPLSVTNLHIRVTTAGSTLTAGQCFAGLWTAAGVKVGVTADQSGVWNTSGYKTMALASGPFAIAAGDYYCGLWYNGTTGPSLARSGQVSGAWVGNVGRSAPDLWACTSSTGLTTTAPDPFGAQSGSNGGAWWFGFS